MLRRRPSGFRAPDGADELHGAYGERACPYERARDADIGDARRRDDQAAHPGARSDAEVEYARVRRHGHRGALLGGVREHFGLEHHVVRGVERTPQRAHRHRGDGVDRRDEQHPHRGGHPDHRASHEREPQARVPAREQGAPDDACRAVEDERERYESVGESRDVLQEGLDVAVAGEMRGGEQRGHQVDVAQRGRGEQSRKAACRKARVASIRGMAAIK